MKRFSIVKIDVEGDRFIGKAVRCDADFVPRLARIGHYAEDCGLFVYVTSSLRDSTDEALAVLERHLESSNKKFGKVVANELQSRLVCRQS